ISNIFPKFTESVDTIRIMSWAIIPFTINAVIFYPRFWANEKNHNVTISIFSLVVIDVIGILILGSKYGIDGVAYAFVIGHLSSLFASIILNRFELKNHDKETTN
ncbi:MAG TPA: polysaccharide biosynthesis C-terminal domain-containing protein, partial [Aquella sp.]|nr:polysaccharide biosynthesis C-terminal domain-containing protein [Aquella sp.]